MGVFPEETANRVLQRSLSIPITMRAVINQGKGKIKQLAAEEADISVGNDRSSGQVNGMSHSGDSMDSKTLSSLNTSPRFKMEGGKMSGGTPACVKSESMDIDSDSKSEVALNMVGLQVTINN